MKHLTTVYNSNNSDNNENLYLYFKLGENKYALCIQQVIEIMKLPLLDYPQKLASNVIGLLNYNNFTINVLDLRFYLNIKVTPYLISNQLLIVKTDESIFGLIIDKVEDIISIEQSKIDYFSTAEEEKIIEFMYKKESETISMINLGELENAIKRGIPSSDIDIPGLFPHDDDSIYKLTQRSRALIEKFNLDLATNIFSQDKFISFELDKNIYCINLEYVKEFFKNLLITPVPCNLDYIAGIIALRGEFITIINTKNFLGFDEEPSATDYSESKNSVILLEMPDYKIGFTVDKIFRIINISEDLIKKNPHNQNQYIQSEAIIGDKPYTILNIKNILSDKRFFINEGA